MSRNLMITLLVICAVVLIVMIFTIIPRIKNALTRMPLIAYFGILIILIAAIAFLAINVFGQRGTDVPVSEISDIIAESDEADGDTIYIVVRGDQVSIGETEIENIGELGQIITGLADKGRKVCISDDYAQARTYKEVRAAVEEAGIPYSEETRQ